MINPPEIHFNSLKELYLLVKKLRSPQGCPWDQKQTIDSMKAFLLEEAYEVIDAINNGNSQDVCSELGDLLMLIFFITDLHSDAGNFTLNEVSKGIQEKLIRRHPHVFAINNHLSDEQINSQWEQIKQSERQQNGISQQPKHHIQSSLPALSYAQKWLNHPSCVKSTSSTSTIESDLQQLSQTTNRSTVESILGNVLWQCAQLADEYEIDAESCLRIRVQKDMNPAPQT